MDRKIIRKRERQIERQEKIIEKEIQGQRKIERERIDVKIEERERDKKIAVQSHITLVDSRCINIERC